MNSTLTLITRSAHSCHYIIAPKCLCMHMAGFETLSIATRLIKGQSIIYHFSHLPLLLNGCIVFQHRTPKFKAVATKAWHCTVDTRVYRDIYMCVVCANASTTRHPAARMSLPQKSGNCLPAPRDPAEITFGQIHTKGNVHITPIRTTSTRYIANTSALRRPDSIRAEC